MLLHRYLKLVCCCLIAGGFLLLVSFKSFSHDKAGIAKALYVQHLEDLSIALNIFRAHAEVDSASFFKADFIHCRDAYKRVEYLVACYYPEMTQRINGAALPESEPGDPAEVILPSGFQVLEEIVYSESAGYKKTVVQRELNKLIYLVGNLREQAAGMQLTETGLLDAIRLNLYRMAAMGLSGFDSPVAQRSVAEARISVATVDQLFKACGRHYPSLDKAVEVGLNMLDTSAADFNSFDRARFLVYCFKPLLEGLHRLQVQQKIPFLKGNRAIYLNAKSFFEADAFNVLFFAPPGTKPAGKELVTLGETLFQETALSTGGRSCASCHMPSKAYTDGIAVNRSLQRDEQLLRNTPTLINAALQPILFWDGRSAYLEDQVDEVIHNKHEMAGRMDQAIAYLNSQRRYRDAFRRAFPDKRDSLSDRQITRALAAYVRSLVQLNTPFDRYMRGDTLAMNKEAVSGFNLFMGKAKCGTCHYMPLFNGAVPPDYLMADGEVIGVPATADTTDPVADKDRGIYQLQGVRHLDGAFRTPGIRHIRHTAPYMHNGVYKTLEEVVDFYDRGGGRGMGLNVPNQTLPADRLNLTITEKKALVAFLKCL